MKKVVNRKNGTLTIEKVKPCKTERREEMFYMLERMAELERLVSTGKTAEKSLSELEKEFKELCEIELEGN